MTDKACQDTIDALDDLLDQEREALLTGDLDRVGRLVEQKENLIDQLAQFEHTQLDALMQLDEKFKRNQVLLDSALDGIRRVARRLSALRRVRNALDTYDAQGERQTIDISATSSFEKRA